MQLRVVNAQSGGVFPESYTCDGKNVSPPLTIDDVPEGTRSIGLYMLDPSVEYGAYTHWLLWNLPPDLEGLPAGIPPGFDLEKFPGAVQGRNSEGDHAYTGPCPPEGEEHNYFLTVFALETELDLDRDTERKGFRHAMRGHVINSTRFHTFYRRKKAEGTDEFPDAESSDRKGDTDEPKGHILDDFS
ncbi:MAG: YbhB/YbcL family Raf kinase inhibitor-like protein [bacterium]